MAPRPEYSIPPGTPERTRDGLYAQYRLQLDEEASRRNRTRIIDVTARRVDLETAAAGTGRARVSQPAAATAQTTSQSTEERGASRRSSRTRNLGGASPPRPETLSYKTDASSGEIQIQSAPYPRGLFVDVIV